jgi:hypothetical protein
VAFDEALGLGTLAGAGGPKKNDSHDGRHSTRAIPTGQTLRYARRP